MQWCVCIAHYAVNCLCFSSLQPEMPVAITVDIQNFEVDENGCDAAVGLPLGAILDDDNVEPSTIMDNSDEADLLLPAHESRSSNYFRESHTSAKNKDHQSLQLGSENLSRPNIKPDEPRFTYLPRFNDNESQTIPGIRYPPSWRSNPPICSEESALSHKEEDYNNLTSLPIATSKRKQIIVSDQYGVNFYT